MKSTKSAKPSAHTACIVSSLAYYANARARKLATPRVELERVMLAPTRASGISRHRFWVRLNVVDNRWVPSGASLCIKR